MVFFSNQWISRSLLKAPGPQIKSQEYPLFSYSDSILFLSFLLWRSTYSSPPWVGVCPSPTEGGARQSLLSLCGIERQKSPITRARDDVAATPINLIRMQLRRHSLDLRKVIDFIQRAHFIVLECILCNSFCVVRVI